MNYKNASPVSALGKNCIAFSSSIPTQFLEESLCAYFSTGQFAPYKFASLTKVQDRYGTNSHDEHISEYELLHDKLRTAVRTIQISEMADKKAMTFTIHNGIPNISSILRDSVLSFLESHIITTHLKVKHGIETVVLSENERVA